MPPAEPRHEISSQFKTLPSRIRRLRRHSSDVSTRLRQTRDHPLSHGSANPTETIGRALVAGVASGRPFGVTNRKWGFLSTLCKGVAPCSEFRASVCDAVVERRCCFAQRALAGPHSPPACCRRDLRPRRQLPAESCSGSDWPTRLCKSVVHSLAFRRCAISRVWRFSSRQACGGLARSLSGCAAE